MFSIEQAGRQSAEGDIPFEAQDDDDDQKKWKATQTVDYLIMSVYFDDTYRQFIWRNFLKLPLIWIVVYNLHTKYDRKKTVCSTNWMFMLVMPYAMPWWLSNRGAYEPKR